jgi:hypothetical protein
MQSRRFQIRVGALLVLIAVLAIVMGVYRLFRRSDTLREMSEFYAQSERMSRLYPRGSSGSEVGLTLNRSDKEETAHYAALKRKYRSAARHPWESVAPDEPEPK